MVGAFARVLVAGLATRFVAAGRARAFETVVFLRTTFFFTGALRFVTVLFLTVVVFLTGMLKQLNFENYDKYY
jgi:hypothetical protein